MEKTALVLSAGGMFGAYQAGAYKAIADLAPPDIVVGASVGALNGWAIASGCAPDDLIARWQDPSAGETLKLLPRHGLRTRWFDAASLRAQAERLCRDYQPRIPLGVVVAELPLFRLRLMRYPDVSALHLQATCSVPLFLPAVQINGKRFVDGGLFEKLPVWAAIAMGATRIIAIDSMPSLNNWWLRAGNNLAHILKPPRRYSPDLDLTVVSASGTLGDASDAVFWKRANIDRWVDMGMRDAANQITLKSVFKP